jgi:trehalose 6-phosphate synthase/phosphatase
VEIDSDAGAVKSKMPVNRRRFIVVSNRLPVTVTRQNGKLVFSHSSGGLATAMSSLDKVVDNQLWIGWPGISSDELTTADKATITKKLRQFSCYPVFLTQSQIHLFYDRYSNETIWPLFHYFQSLAEYDSASWEAYRNVNALFRNAVKKHADADTTIWVHDYHLLLLPQLLRQVLPESSIGFFLHIPFPSFEIFRLLPNRQEILEGMLGADLIGFHVYDYARHFLSSALRTLGYSNNHGTITLSDRIAYADAFPISIDYEKFVQAARSSETKAQVATLSKHYNQQRIIVSIDRLDYSKGIAQRLEAFRQFLELHPEQHKKVVLVMVAIPSRMDVRAYQDIRETIEQTISRINGTFGTVDWTPISYQFKNLPFEQVVPLLVIADVALVTPLRDGMNLVAKEYVAAKQKRPGVLILSELTGASHELPESIHINPNDTRSIVRALEVALRMPKKEQRIRMEAMQSRLSRYTVQRWAHDFIEQLESVKKLQSERYDKNLKIQNKRKLISSFKHSNSRALFLDYDGTLANFVSSPLPEKARPTKALLRTIQALALTAGTDVFIVSGRPREALESWFGSMPVTLVAEHGFWVKQKGEWFQQEASFQEHKPILLSIMARYAERTPGAKVEEKNYALVWHYRNVSPELAYARNANLKHELDVAINNSDIEIFNGNKVMEIKPRGVHKGTVLDEFLIGDPYDFILAVGDDQTDEDMFKALPQHAFSIKVGTGDTSAKFRLLSVAEVHALLNQLTSPSRS